MLGCAGHQLRAHPQLCPHRPGILPAGGGVPEEGRRLGHRHAGCLPAAKRSHSCPACLPDVSCRPARLSKCIGHKGHRAAQPWSPLSPAPPDFGMLASAPDTAMHRSRARSFGGNLRYSASFEALGAAAVMAGLSGPAALRGIAADPAAGAKLAARGGKAPPAATPPPANGVNAVPGDAATGGGDAAVQHGGAGTMPGSPAAPYVSSFGSLPLQFAGQSPQLRRILLTHAPYMSKLESIASSATRWTACTAPLPAHLAVASVPAEAAQQRGSVSCPFRVRGKRKILPNAAAAACRPRTQMQDRREDPRWPDHRHGAERAHR